MSEGPTIGDWTQYGWIPDDASSFPARIRLRDTAWMVYYEPDVTGLKAEVLMLRKENERLHADQAHWELGNCPSCPNVVSLQEALEQNAKLRELAQRLLTEYRYMRVRPRRMYLEHEVRMRLIEDEMRSLGIEVPA